MSNKLHIRKIKLVNISQKKYEIGMTFEKSVYARQIHLVAKERKQQ
jgi:hypothetical protein